jgi:peptidoglycan hydrolase-like amidase
VHSWSASLRATDLETRFPAVGTLRRIRVTARDGNGEWGGRVTDMAFVFTGGRATLSGDDARSYLGLYSDWFTFSVIPRQKGPARQ